MLGSIPIIPYPGFGTELFKPKAVLSQILTCRVETLADTPPILSTHVRFSRSASRFRCNGMSSRQEQTMTGPILLFG